MPYNLSITNRCQLLKNVSFDFWNDIILMHKTGVNSSEIYYTKKLLSLILTHSGNLNFSVWASEPGLEKTWGSDIDIYIERNTDDFKLYAFQAKLLKLGNEYKDLDRYSNGSYQWTKLENYKVLKKCYINYLFYNGVDNFTFTGMNKCDLKYAEDQLGLSYVSVDDVKRIVPSKHAWFFQDFHTSLSHPLSELVCCPSFDDSSIKSYSYQDIVATFNDFQQLIYLDDINLHFNKAAESNMSSDEKSNNENSERTPDVVIIVRNTSSAF